MFENGNLGHEKELIFACSKNMYQDKVKGPKRVFENGILGNEGKKFLAYVKDLYIIKRNLRKNVIFFFFSFCGVWLYSMESKEKPEINMKM